MPSVFDDLRVLDLSTRLSGAFCARLFADFGADVVLAEPPEGHPLRHEPPFLDDRPGPDRSLLHAYVNANKRAVRRAPDDPDGLAALVRWADVVVTTDPAYRHDDLARLNPAAVQVSVTPYGLDGPLAGVPGNDLTAYALSSWALSNGDADKPPLKGSANQVGYVAGLCAFVGAAAAVYARDRARTAIGSAAPGQLVDVSELEALTLIAGPAILVAEYSGAVAPRGRPGILRGPVPCRDGHFALTISRAHFWRDAMNVLGLHDLADDPRLASGIYRRQHREEWTGRVEARLREWRRWDLFEALAAVRCVAGVVLDTHDINTNPHLAARGFFVETVVAGERHVPFPGAPFKMSRTPWALRRPAPPVTDEGGRMKEEADEVARHAPAPPSSFVPHPSGGPLAGIRAIVLTQAWSGTFATELLGLLGAEVIQIEARRRPDSWRGEYGGTVPEAIRDPARRQRPWNTNGLYNAVNLNKRAITLDLTHPRGLDLFRRLVPYADVVAENFSPRVMGNLGLDYAALRRIRPDIILGSLSAYGATGPYANVPGIGGTIEPMSGMSSLLGYEDGPPQNSGSMYPDPVAGFYLAAALIMALRHRDRTGEGQHIDLSMMEANATFIGDALLEEAANGRVRPRLGNHHLRIAPHNIYPARDGRWLALSADDEAAWRALCRHIGRPDLIGDRRFADMAARKAHEAQLDEVIAAWAREQDADAAAAALRALGLCAAPMLDTRTVLANEQLRARGFFVMVEHPEAGRHPQAGVPWQFSRTPASVTRPAPMLGEHSREVLAGFLGVTDAEYEELVACGVTGDMPPD
jgi:crotonobetainyl-CoA:carnitine CoA-transferase CaiB-like acyl-CoA transferase